MSCEEMDLDNASTNGEIDDQEENDNQSSRDMPHINEEDDQTNDQGEEDDLQAFEVPLPPPKASFINPAHSNENSQTGRMSTSSSVDGHSAHSQSQCRPKSQTLRDNEHQPSPAPTDMSNGYCNQNHSNGPHSNSNSVAGGDDDRRDAISLANQESYQRSMSAAAQFAYYQYSQSQPNEHDQYAMNTPEAYNAAMASPVLPPPPPPPPEPEPEKRPTPAPPKKDTQKATTFAQLDDSEDFSECKPCGTKFTDSKAYHAHCRGSSHTMRLLMMGKDAGIVSDELPREEPSRSASTRATLSAPYGDETEKAAVRKSSFYCNVCKVSTDTQVILDIHLTGKKHLKNMAMLHPKDPRFANPNESHDRHPGSGASDPSSTSAITSAPAPKKLQDRWPGHNIPKPIFYGPFTPPPGMAVVQDVVTRSENVQLVETGDIVTIQPAIDTHQQPLLALDMMYEILPLSGPIRYWCDLCEARMDRSTVFSHIAGSKHRLKYLKNHHGELCSEILAYQDDKTVLMPLVLAVAQKCEKLYGRAIMKQKKEMSGDIDKATDAHINDRGRAPSRPIENRDQRRDSSESRDGPDAKRARANGPQPLMGIHTGTGTGEQPRFSGNYYEEEEEPPRRPLNGPSARDMHSEHAVYEDYHRPDRARSTDRDRDRARDYGGAHAYEQYDRPVRHPLDHRDTHDRDTHDRATHDRDTHDRDTHYEQGGYRPLHVRRPDMGIRMSESSMQRDARYGEAPRRPSQAQAAPQAKPAGGGGMNLKNLLSVIAKSAIKNEEDANFAFQISNSLTQALVEYRIANPKPGDRQLAMSVLNSQPISAENSNAVANQQSAQSAVYAQSNMQPSPIRHDLQAAQSQQYMAVRPSIAYGAHTQINQQPQPMQHMQQPQPMQHMQHMQYSANQSYMQSTSHPMGVAGSVSAHNAMQQPEQQSRRSEPGMLSAPVVTKQNPQPVPAVEPASSDPAVNKAKINDLLNSLNKVLAGPDPVPVTDTPAIHTRPAVCTTSSSLPMGMTMSVPTSSTTNTVVTSANVYDSAASTLDIANATSTLSYTHTALSTTAAASVAVAAATNTSTSTPLMSPIKQDIPSTTPTSALVPPKQPLVLNRTIPPPNLEDRGVLGLLESTATANMAAYRQYPNMSTTATHMATHPSTHTITQPMYQDMNVPPPALPTQMVNTSTYQPSMSSYEAVQPISGQYPNHNTQPITTQYSLNQPINNNYSNPGAGLLPNQNAYNAPISNGTFTSPYNQEQPVMTSTNRSNDDYDNVGADLKPNKPKLGAGYF